MSENPLFRRHGNDIYVSQPLVNFNRKAVNGETQIIKVREVLNDGTLGRYFNFGTNVWQVVDPGNHTLPENGSTGKYEDVMEGAYFSGLNYLDVYLLNTGKVKSDFTAIYEISNQQLLDDIFGSLAAVASGVLVNNTRGPDIEALRRDIRLLIAATERTKKGRL